ncbi:metallophosphoesterase family protein [Evansella cellulosilytica]|uniref:Metallophosphoesterase n=1 Tax=Evansella cellulosilytica (strain ATCC 21833 / DSM 2522 / FERM P-1141 / JCM 9156 / N-4) TaxID=649639 RepID=E6U0I0_EVAC2|nr:metallophosphoesterase family protein [Evansella cellulosilytica]ADU31425.1 metallophosphoesterase [Evansella cellulosilytica DSM 2522]
MKIAFISDIHGNATALEAVLHDIERKQVDKIVVLGDICYRGPEPKRSLQLVQQLNTTVLKGNADEWVVRGIQEGEVPQHALNMMRKEREWIVERLDSHDLTYLENLPTNHVLQFSNDLNIHCFHATPSSLFDVVPQHEQADSLSEKLMSQEEAGIYLYAHIHLPYVKYINGKVVANLGSVGLPFDGTAKSSYLIVEDDNGQVQLTIQRVDYDIEKVVEQYQSLQYPNSELMINVVRNARLP